MARVWTCQGCGTKNQRIKQRCPICARKRPDSRPPAHRAILEQPYELWVERFGETCGICGKGRTPSRRLDRDHSHDLPPRMRGLLCWWCNMLLDDRATPEWLRAAADYLERSKEEEAA